MILIGYANYMMLDVLVMCVQYTHNIPLLIKTKNSEDINVYVMSIYDVI